MLRTIFWFITIIFLLILALPLWLVALISPEKDKTKYINALIAFMKRPVMAISGLKFNTTGSENLPNEPALYVLNHQGLFDILVALSQLNGFKPLLAKIEASKIPLISSWMKIGKCVFIDRGNPKESLRAIKQCEELLKEGYSVVIFPEGTRSRKHEMNSFKPGALRCALKAEVPIVPVVIDKSYVAWEMNGKRITPTTIDVTILPPIRTKGLSKERTKVIAEEIEAMMKAQLGQIDPPSDTAAANNTTTVDTPIGDITVPAGDETTEPVPTTETVESFTEPDQATGTTQSEATQVLETQNA